MLNLEEKNIVLYDWLSFTSKVHSPDELINALGLGHVPWTETKGARGYRDRKYFSCISIHYNGRDDMGVWVEMSGQGCRTFESLSTIKWEDLFKFIHKNDLHMTRLDVAFDDHTGILPMDQIIADAQAGMFVSRMNYWETVLSSKGATVQIGSPQSKVLIRIYDKAAERGYDSDVHWIRCEMQLRDSPRIFSFLCASVGSAPLLARGAHRRELPSDAEYFTLGSYPAVHWTNNYGSREIMLPKEVASATVLRSLKYRVHISPGVRFFQTSGETQLSFSALNPTAW